MLEQRRDNVCLVFPRPLVRLRYRYYSLAFCLLISLFSRSRSEPVGLLTASEGPQPAPLPSTQTLASVADPPVEVQLAVDDDSTSRDPSSVSSTPAEIIDENEQDASKADDQHAVDGRSKSTLKKSTAETDEPVSSRAFADVYGEDGSLQKSIMTVSIVVGAAETVRDCTKEAHSQTFLMTLARRFQQLQLLPLLVAIGQQSLRVVASHNRTLGHPSGTSASHRVLEPDSLLLHRYPSPLEKRQPVMLVEVASRPPPFQQLLLANSSGLRSRSAALPPQYFWPATPDGLRSPIQLDRAPANQNPSQLIPQSQFLRHMEQPPPSRRSAFGEREVPAASAGSGSSTAQNDGSFVGSIMQALETTPFVRINLGDLACSALPTSPFSRKLSCWLLKAFSDRILCRTAWFDPCQALTEEEAHGRPLLSPVVLPPGGLPTLSLPLKPLLNERRTLPKRISRDLIAQEGPTYQLLWQALTRLDDMWALAYCGRKIPPDPPFRNTYARQSSQEEDTQGSSKPSEKHQGEQQQQRRGSNDESPTQQNQNTSSPVSVNRVEVAGDAESEPLPSESSAHRSDKPGEEATESQPEKIADPALQTSTNQDTENAFTEAPAEELTRSSDTESSATDAPSDSSDSSSTPKNKRYSERILLPETGDLLPGWRTELVLKALSPGIENRMNVLAVVGRKGTEVLIAFRGTKTQVEWILNGQSEHAFRWLHEGEGRTAAGFSHIFSSAWPALQVYLASVNKPEAPLTRIILTGYSLGGAVAALMAYGVALNYPTKVDAVLFGSPRTGDSAFATSWARKVNGRSIAFTLDPIPRTPCREMPACDKRGMQGPLTLPSNFLKWASTSPRTGGAGGGPEDYTTTSGYGDLAGLVSFGPEELGGSSVHKIHPVYVSYNHICTYPCWLATNFNSADRRTQCEMPEPTAQWDTGLPPQTCPALLS